MTIIVVVTIPEIAALLRIFTILRDSYLILGPLSLRFPPKIILSKVEVFGMCLKITRKVSGSCLECVLNVSASSMEGARKVTEIYLVGD